MKFMELSSFIISLVAVIIATTSTIISYLLFRDAKDPEVVTYTIPDERRPSIINLIIENTGRSSGWDVTFSSSKPVPQYAFGIENADQPKVMDHGPIVNGIPCLGPGSKRIITWGQYGGIRKGIGDGYLDITATYYSRPTLAFKRRKHVTVSRLDIKSFENTDVSDHNWDKKIAEQLEKIASSVSKMQSKPENALKVTQIDTIQSRHDT
ncbi:MAG: hypothetical protein ACQETL_19885 [Bacteroidota bacterium]